MKAILLMRHSDLVVVGRGEATSADRTLQRVVRFADNAAWLAAEEFAVGLRNTSDELGTNKDDVAIISISSTGPRTTLKRTARDIESQFVSPLRFPAANPASIASLPCIAFGFTGPTLNITLPPSRGVRIALLLADAWIGRGAARVVSLVTYQHDSGREPLARCLLLANASTFAGFPETLLSDVQWLENFHFAGCYR